jgi:sarcosine oxidase subunit delta
MLLIPCPNCGDRDETEFSYGGPARSLPELDGNSDADDWHRALHLRDHSNKPRSEFWYHHAGCEHWIMLTRDLRDHRFMGTEQ